MKNNRKNKPLQARYCACTVSISAAPSASLTIWRIGRSVNGLSVKVPAPRMVGLGWYQVRKKAVSDYRVRRKTGRLHFEVFQQHC
jgi:hypothetical protein